MKNFKAIMLIVFLLVACGKTIVRKSYPKEFAGQTQVVLASETTNISFTDTLEKKFLFIKLSDAQVRVDASVTFDFYVDLQKDGYQVKIDSTNDVLHFLAPPIRVKKPQYNTREVSYPDRGILVDEEKEALRILNKLADKIIEGEGKALLKEQYIIDKCKDQLQKFLTDLCRELNYDIGSIVVEFYKSDIPT